MRSTSTACLKRGRPIGSKDKIPRKRKELIEYVGTSDIIITPEENLKKELVLDKSEEAPPEEAHIPEIKIVENEKISINYVNTEKRWNRNEVIIDNIFAYAIAIDIINESECHNLLARL